MLIHHQILEKFVADMIAACGASPEDSACVANHLVGSSMMRCHSHGLMRVPEYHRLVEEKVIIPNAPRTIIKDQGSCMILDYGWNFGPVAANDGIRSGIGKATEYGTSSISVTRSSHAARIGAYVQHAAELGFIALAFCNSGNHGHWVAPYGGRKGRLATNPISFAFPSGDNADPLVSDFSTAAMPEGRIRMKQKKGEPVGDNVLVDAEGEPTNNPDEFYGPPQGAILPFGGSMGYRGFALGLLVEALGGLLAGQSMLDPYPGNGLGFILINPEFFCGTERFSSLIDEMRTYMKNTPTDHKTDEIMLPGELEFRNYRHSLEHGVEVIPSLLNEIIECARKLKVNIPQELLSPAESD